MGGKYLCIDTIIQIYTTSEIAPWLWSHFKINNRLLLLSCILCSPLLSLSLPLPLSFLLTSFLSLELVLFTCGCVLHIKSRFVFSCEPVISNFTFTYLTQKCVVEDLNMLNLCNAYSIEETFLHGVLVILKRMLLIVECVS